MATTVKTFAFATTAEGFTGYPGSTDGDVTLAYSSGSGNPAGSLFADQDGNGLTSSDAYWEWSGTWEDLGVPAGATVSGVASASADYQAPVCERETTAQVDNVVLTDGSNNVTLAGVRSWTAPSATWFTENGTDVTDLPDLASDNTVTIRVNLTMVNDAHTQADIQIYVDNIQFTITYIPAADLFGVTTTGDSIGLTSSAPIAGQCPIVTLVTDVTKGTLNLSQDGSFTYTYTGTNNEDADSFTYKLTDTIGTTSNATVSLTITAGATPAAETISLQGNTPTVSAEQGLLIETVADALSLAGSQPTVSVSANQNISVSGDVLSLTGNTPGVDIPFSVITTGDTIGLAGNTPTVTIDSNVSIVTTGDSISLTSSAPIAGQCPVITLVTDVTKGSLNLSQDGSFTYDYTGTNNEDTDEFIYKITDINGTTSNATVSITISAGATPAADSISLTGNTPTINIGDGFTAAPGNDVLSLVGSTPTMPVMIYLVTDVTQGNLTLNQDGSFVYVPTGGSGSYSDSFQYYFVDDDGKSNTATVTITVNACVTTTGDSFTLAGGTSIVTVAENATSVATTGDTLSLSGNVSAVNVGDAITFVTTGDTLAITSSQPVIDIPFSTTVTQDNISLAGGTPTVDVSDTQVVTPLQDTLALAGQQPTVTTGGNVIAIPSSDTLSLTGNTPTVDVSNVIEVVIPAQQITLTGHPPAIVISSFYYGITTGCNINLTGSVPSVLIQAGATIPSCKYYTVEAEDRVYTVEAEDKIYTVEAENRIYTVSGCE